MDLTNNSALPGAPGAGATGATIITTNNANPGTTTRFTLFVNNTSASGDTYNLSATGLLPGWTVVFRDAASTVITNTGVVAGAGNKQVFADVTIPAGQAAIVAPGQSIAFTATSPSTGATDLKTDAVIVNTVRSVVLTPNNIGQVFPGGSVVYTHTITNTGNVTETNIALTLAESQATGFTSIVYIDTNNNNVVDTPPDTVAGTISLAPGASLQLLVKVTAGSGVGIGLVDTTTLTATTTGTINAIVAPPVVIAADATTVIAGNLVLLKEQALDANCDGTADTAFVTATITTGAIPGACIRYRITATNNGNANVTGLVVSDSTPAATTYTNVVAAATVPVSTITAPANGAIGTVSANVGTLTPSASVVLTFGVKINP